jgi:type II secretory ATPase GspE/PulE/Tfp pilus assembly ATPase PilB-like protein
LSEALLATVSQRLARRLCTHCREPYEPEPEDLADLASEYHYAGHRRYPSRVERDTLVAAWHASYGQGTGIKLYRAAGCMHCKQSGYAGRLGMHELLVVDDSIRRLIRSQTHASEIQSAALATGMLTLRQNGILKVLQGLTDIHEVRAASV